MEYREDSWVDPVPVEVGATLRRNAVWGTDVTQRFVGANEVWVAFRAKSGPATVRYVGDGTRMSVRAWGAGADEAVASARVQLGAEDSSWRYESDHPLVGPWLRRARGLRFGRSGRVLERLVPVIIAQKVTSADASRTFRELVRLFGEPAPGPSDLWLAPSAERLSELAYFDLHPVNLERRRAEVILRMARRASRLEELTALAPSEAYARLLAYPGIGPWTAALVTSAVHGDADAVPVGDYHLPNHVVHALTGRARGTDAEMLELLEPFRPYRGRALAAIVREGPSAPRFGPRMPNRDFRRS